MSRARATAEPHQHCERDLTAVPPEKEGEVEKRGHLADMPRPCWFLGKVFRSPHGDTSVVWVDTAEETLKTLKNEAAKNEADHGQGPCSRFVMQGFNSDGTAKSGPAPVTEERISFLRQLKVLTVKNYKIKKSQTCCW